MSLLLGIVGAILGLLVAVIQWYELQDEAAAYQAHQRDEAIQKEKAQKRKKEIEAATIHDVRPTLISPKEPNIPSELRDGKGRRFTYTNEWDVDFSPIFKIEDGPQEYSYDASAATLIPRPNVLLDSDATRPSAFSGECPSAISYVEALLWPLFGFLAFWIPMRSIAWVIEGFAHDRRNRGSSQSPE